MLVGVDFETYYSKKKGSEFSLSSMPTEAYIRDPRFQVIGASFQFDQGPVEWIHATNIDAYIRATMTPQDIVVSHNGRFDCGILYHHFKYIPAFMFCTLSMARAAGLSSAGSCRLGDLSDRLIQCGLPIQPKGDEVVRADGKRLEDFTPYEYAAYGEYCKTDTANTMALFFALFPHLPVEELIYQHHILSSSIYPRQRFNKDILVTETARLKNMRDTLVNEAAKRLGIAPETVPKEIRSPLKFRTILEAFGGAVSEQAWQTGSFGEGTYEEYLRRRNSPYQTRARFIIPTKKSERQSDTKGKTVLVGAYSKNDKEFKELSEIDDPHMEDVAFLANLKMGLSSTIQETRTARFLTMSGLGPIGVPVNISGAHTHRQSGADKLNEQNLPSGRLEGQTTALSDCIEVPYPGYLFVDRDASQIEPRISAYIAGQSDLLEDFAMGRDPYSRMGGSVYGRDPAEIAAGAKADPKIHECYLIRQLGKALVLGAGYGMGYRRFKVTASLAPYYLNIDLDMAEKAIGVYREVNKFFAHKEYGIWARLNRVIAEMIEGGTGYFGGPNNDMFYYGRRQVFDMDVPGIRGPSGLWLVYPGLKFEKGVNFYNQKEEWLPVFFRQRRYGGPEKTRFYGAKALENITQHTAFEVGKWQMNPVWFKYPHVLNRHDGWTVVAREEEAEAANRLITERMALTPPWLTGCPLDSEGGIGRSLGTISKC